MEEQILSIVQLKSYIKNKLEGDSLLRSFVVKGEVSNLKQSSAGHIYFSLIEGTAMISCVMFRGNVSSGLRCRLENGSKIKVQGSISVYETHSQYQIIARIIENYGAGDLYKKYIELKEKLQNEGLFNKAHKKPIPSFAKKIGVVTAETGAVINDIQRVARRRNPNIEIILYPSKVQGEGATENIIRGLEYLDKYTDVDVIIIGRGGGSMEDLWCFNEESLARAIFQANKPIISAVGHETDIVISDFVADRRAATPSEAAEIAVFHLEALLEEIESLKSRLNEKIIRRIEDIRLDLVNIDIRLQKEITNRVAFLKLKLRNKYSQLSSLKPENKIKHQKELLKKMYNQLNRGLYSHVYETRLDFNNAKERLSSRIDSILLEQRQLLRLKEEQLKRLSISDKLDNGFALISYKGKIVKSVKDINTGNDINLTLKDGKLVANVKEKLE